MPSAPTYAVRAAIVGCVAAAAATQSPADAARAEFFENRIRPVLSTSCYECHSTHGKQRGGVVLDHRAGMRAEGTEGVLVVPGEPSKSVLLMVMRHELEGLEMPEDGARLGDDVVADFERWIRDGAYDPRDEPPSADELRAQTSWGSKLAQRRSWWSLQPVVAHEPPSGSGWSAHPVDRFVEAAHLERGLGRAEPASRRALLRRLHYVITGLPPSPAQLAAFEQDERPDAYERVVDGLLASPTYGERWARHWMDVVRYADSHGSEGDPAVPHAYRYRDYLIRAFNDDVPYDQLVREHVAGDLLDRPRVDEERGVMESTLGTAHYRFVFHGYLPTEPLEEKVRFVDDQINVLGKAFLGQTISCARCHDHKFDAISQRDYYALFGVLSSCRPGVLDANSMVRQREGVEALRDRKQALRAKVAAVWLGHVDEGLRDLFSDVPDDVEEGHPGWLLREVDRRRGGDGRDFAAALRVVLDERAGRAADELPAGARRTAPTDAEGWYFEGNGLHDGASPAGSFAVAPEGDRVLLGIYPAGAYTHLDARRHRGVLHSARFDVGPSQAAWALVLGEQSHLRVVVRDYPRSGLTFSRVNLDHDRWRWRRVDLSYWQGDRAHVELTTGQDAPVEVGGGEDGFFGLREVRVQPISAPAPGPDADPYGLFAAVRAKWPKDRAQLVDVLRSRVGVAVSRWAAGACKDADALLLDACIEHGLLPNGVDAFSGIEVTLQRLRALAAAVPAPTRVAGLVEADAADHPMFERGDPSQPGEVVPRRFLEVLGGARYQGAQSGRRALAEDLASADNPLTARVMVNRVWHHVFGRGLVATPDNFGRLGAVPTHPELLDYLAARFVSEGWSIKRLVRHLVTSKTWRLSSFAPAELVAADPDGAWWTRARVRRLTAEALRDSLFAVAGELRDERYGPPFGANSSTPRRSVYVRQRRNDLDQFLAAFDAPTPFAPVGARLATNVPAQSLAMLNAPMVWELAERWAGRTEQNEDDNVRASGMFEAATGRLPTTAERDQLLDYVRAAAQAASAGRAARDETEGAIAAASVALAELLAPVRAQLLGELDAEPGVAPYAAWDFCTGVEDQVGNMHGTLRGSARCDERGLVLDGAGWLATAPLDRPLAAKTLEAWVQLDGLDQSGGGVVTVQDLAGDVFDAIVYGERERGRWIAGSDHFRRTDDVGGPVEAQAATRPVHVAAVYDGKGGVALFRDGRPYGESYRTGVARFEAGAAQVLIGLRHGDRAGGRALRGRVTVARLYDRALSAEELAASAAGRPFVSRERVLRELAPSARAQVARLDDRLARLREQLVGQEEAAEERDPWTLLAHALFNLKEFQFLR